MRSGARPQVATLLVGEELPYTYGPGPHGSRLLALCPQGTASVTVYPVIQAVSTLRCGSEKDTVPTGLQGDLFSVKFHPGISSWTEKRGNLADFVPETAP